VPCCKEHDYDEDKDQLEEEQEEENGEANQITNVNQVLRPIRNQSVV